MEQSTKKCLVQYEWGSQVVLVVKNPPNAGDEGSIPGSGRAPGLENGNPLQYFYS